LAQEIGAPLNRSSTAAAIGSVEGKVHAATAIAHLLPHFDVPPALIAALVNMARDP